MRIQFDGSNRQPYGENNGKKQLHSQKFTICKCKTGKSIRPNFENCHWEVPFVVDFLNQFSIGKTSYYYIGDENLAY